MIQDIAWQILGTFRARACHARRARGGLTVGPRMLAVHPAIKSGPGDHPARRLAAAGQLLAGSRYWHCTWTDSYAFWVRMTQFSR